MHLVHLLLDMWVWGGHDPCSPIKSSPPDLSCEGACVEGEVEGGPLLLNLPP